MSRTTLSVGDSFFTNSLPSPTADDFTSSFIDSKNDFNRARDAITTAQKVGIGIGVTVAILAIISVITIVIMIMRKNRRRRQQIEQNGKIYEHHRVDPSLEGDMGVYGGGGGGVGNVGGNGYEMAGKSELGGAGIVGEQHSGQVYGPPGNGRAEIGGATTGELGGQEVRGELGDGKRIVNGGSEKVVGRRNDPVELQ